MISEGKDDTLWRPPGAHAIGTACPAWGRSKTPVLASISSFGFDQAFNMHLSTVFLPRSELLCLEGCTQPTPDYTWTSITGRLQDALSAGHHAAAGCLRGFINQAPLMVVLLLLVTVCSEQGHDLLYLMPLEFAVGGAGITVRKFYSSLVRRVAGSFELAAHPSFQQGLLEYADQVEEVLSPAAAAAAFGSAAPLVVACTQGYHRPGLVPRVQRFLVTTAQAVVELGNWRTAGDRTRLALGAATIIVRIIVVRKVTTDRSGNPLPASPEIVLSVEEGILPAGTTVKVQVRALGAGATGYGVPQAHTCVCRSGRATRCSCQPSSSPQRSTK
jgi:hypothetical protein